MEFKMSRCKYPACNVLFFMGVALVCGCREWSHESNHQAKDDTYVLEFVESNPASPAVLGPGDKLNILVYYSIPSHDQVYIWARPFHQGQKMGSYKAHHLIPINGNIQTEGMAEMWFLFDEPATADEIRIFMKEDKSDTIIKTTSQAIEVRWE